MERQKEHHGQRTANGRLERYADFDDGPDDTGLIVGGVPPVVREVVPVYEVQGEPLL
ncbi:MAG: hypothetical protein PVH41_04495 [Anaerolineae bacterium]